ncbi:unnamed protein product [Clavelina lepadiformis]|uniref:non-specific serine/threonine protein kinase n=1 Tax=Clavelina lepadiformis TaxID=159417 RepID=A0ABP0G4N5_CLALP
MWGKMDKFTGHLMPRGLDVVGRWARSKLAEVDVLFKDFKDVVSKVGGKEKVQKISSNEVKNVGSQVAPKQSLFLNWRPQLQNFRSSLKENAFKVQQQVNYRNALGENTFFRKDFMWRRARNMPLIAFAGLFICNEEDQLMSQKVAAQYKIYETVCKNIKTMFPEYEYEHTLAPDTGGMADDYELIREEDRMETGVIKYQAKVKDQVDKSTDEVMAAVALDDYVWESNLPFAESLFSPEFAVKVIIPPRGCHSNEVILKQSEGDSVRCGRGQFGNHDGQDGTWPRKKLPPHPNIVAVERMFVDKFHQRTDETSSNYDKALYVVTKRYPVTLAEYLKHTRPDGDIACLIILQLLEAVSHLVKNHIVHRSINCDNIMLGFDEQGFPHALLDSFGSAYVASSYKDMLVPFYHTSLDTRICPLSSQAPEIAKAKAGRRQFVDYRKSDAWSVGCVAYHVLTGANPFQCDGVSLDSRQYTGSDLPCLDDVDVSLVLKVVAQMLLNADHNKRLSAAEAADILHLELFATPPVGNFSEDMKCKELHSWMVDHCAEVFARRTHDNILYQLSCSFFARLDSKQFSRAFYLWDLLKV